MVCLQSLHSVGVVTISFHIFHICPSGLFSLAFIFFCWSASCLLYVLWISSIYFAYNITWFALCILFPFSFLLLHGVYIVGIMGFVWWGVLFCCICTTTSLSIPCSPYNVYSSILFSVLFCMLISSFTYPPIFAFSSFVCVFSMLGWKLLGGVCICIICSYVWV